ncbi:Predicted arabinose efflux permease, MFS family [Paenibacillus sophorae]|uniref:MFS transporter n=1 Tax=Paenibacillus sophorae TaxID=1333845 RepID=A0A1H8S5Y7_9BACL|nr:MFS transporter [Paenibacillus sophorae]QWU16858.1 MFS transporter [Paenibacillus sophorae]SEO74429.1 Predicted arabinose efflux permease, MFS family [Paenibacillus sophorae]
MTHQSTAKDGISAGYYRLFAAGIINGIGDRFSQVAMLSLIFQLTGSGMAVGLSLGVKLIPYLALAPLGGFLGGKLPRKTVMMATDIARIPFALSFLWVTGEDRLWLLYVGSFMLAAGEAIYAPVRKSSIPLLARRDALLRTNGMEQMLTGCVLILGALTGGFVSHWFGPQTAFVLNAVSFLAAALILSGISFPHTPPEGLGDEDEGLHGTDMAAKAGAGERSSSPKSLPALIAGSVCLQIVLGYELLVSLVSGLDNVLISVYAIRVFNAGDIGVGVFYASLGAGLTLSFWTGRLVKRNLLAAALGGLLLEGLLHIGISAAGSFAAVCGLYVLASLASGIVSASLDTLLMRETPARWQPLLFGLMTAAGSMVLGLSMLLAGYLLTRMEPRLMGLAGGVCFAAIAVVLGAYAWMKDRRGRKVSVLSRTP